MDTYNGKPVPLSMSNRVIFLADCQSFYASVEKAERPKYRDKPLVVAGAPERRSGIVLAACPIAKSYGITTAENIGDALAKCRDLIIVKPQMQKYIDVSMLITNIYKSFTDLVEPYSIDEQFMDVTGSLTLFGDTPETLAKRIQQKVYQQTGIYTRYGVSTNKILAKTACDNYAKKNDTGIYTLLQSDLPNTLWYLPVDKMFMVGSRMTQHFNAMGLDTIGKVANTPLDKFKNMMRFKLGKQSDVSAELYWRIANGIDPSPVTPATHDAAPKSIGNQMTLPRDYYLLHEIKVICLELTELVCRRCRSKGYMAQVVSLGCMGADYDRPSGFHRQIKMNDPTNVTNQVYKVVVDLLQQHWDGLPVRKIGVSLSSLTYNVGYQLSIFDLNRDRDIALEKATDAIKNKYGDASILRASSATPAGQALHRSNKIGGHDK